MKINKIISISLTIISATIFLYIFYLMFVFKDAANKSYYFNYFIISIIFLILSIITFFLPYKIKQNVFVLVFSITLTLYILEGF